VRRIGQRIVLCAIPADQCDARSGKLTKIGGRTRSCEAFAQRGVGFYTYLCNKTFKQTFKRV
jgi:hypothetical protein